MKKLESYYRREGETYLIEIKLKRLDQLFNSLDPSPFLARDLDENARGYIVDAVSEFSLSTPLKLVFYLPDTERSTADSIFPQALHHYFNYCQRGEQRRLRVILRQGRIALFVGLLFLFVCLSLSELVVTKLGKDTFAHFVEEGLIIIGWVALWQPAEIFLYRWWPVRYRQRVFEKLSRIPIEIRPFREHPEREAFDF
ncbi:hypothetical protein V0288_16765 [Pannus brasiliensis CCIBt3594]|uniref:Uncharacterized protein n=1 Tax=Pannus brasiliensis CCIBt3594 TaxID=1427578 RepID=A0AAW9QX79_9CHRO